MAADDILRRYLEQRRELGETELVLDSMSVEEALRIIGARGSTTAATTGTAAAAGDWRAALGGKPPAREGGLNAPAPVRRAPAPTTPRGEMTGPPPDVRMRAAASASTDPDAKGKQTRDSISGGETPATPVSLEGLPQGIVIGSASRELFGEAAQWNSLGEIASAVGACTKCELYRTATNPVPGEGNPNADLVCVGEAPGATEDAQGRPFVGQAGQLLTKILAAIDLSRDDVFICNVLKHRPPGNRNPEPDEVAACSPYLVRQIELLRPRVILALGTFAAQTLLQTRESIGKLRSRIHYYHGVPLIVTYHPAALLRNPGWKRPTWEDVQLARKLLDRPAAST